MSDGFDAAAKRAAGQEKRGLSGGLSRRRVVQGAAWSVPAIAIALPVPAFAGASQGILQLEGTGCKLPGNSNETYKGYAFNLTASNTTANFYCIRIISATLNGENLGAVTTINLAGCTNLGNPFCLAPGATLTDLAIITANAASSSNGQLVVTYDVKETAAGPGVTCANTCSGSTTGFGADLTASTGINDVFPINGESCRDFTPAQKTCLSQLAL
jgi:hypothetical protein